MVTVRVGVVIVRVGVVIVRVEVVVVCVGVVAVRVGAVAARVGAVALHAGVVVIRVGGWCSMYSREPSNDSHRSEVQPGIFYREAGGFVLRRGQHLCACLSIFRVQGGFRSEAVHAA